MDTKRKIIFRDTIEETIFDEMKELYPTQSSESGVEYKQDIPFLSLPVYDTQFNISGLIYDCEDAGLDPYKTLSVLLIIVRLACQDYGYYSIYDRSYIDRINCQTHIERNEIKKIIEFLNSESENKNRYIYIFGNKITNVYSLRTFETVMSSRKIDREKKARLRSYEKQEKNKSIQHTSNINNNIKDEEVNIDFDVPESENKEINLW